MEDLNQAKEDAIDMWSDCRHLIHMLKKIETDVEVANKRSALSSTIISELESQLEATKLSTKSKREEELNVTKMINEINDDLEETQEELAEVILVSDEKRHEREELKQMLMIRRQTRDALQLTHRALRLEVECFRASAAEALENIAKSERDSTTVQLTQEDLDAMTREAVENTFLQEWRVSASTEQRFATQERRDFYLKRFQELHRLILYQGKS
ncbi:hypothetical protein AgCh_012491 [Apium graveolens]